MSRLKSEDHALALIDEFFPREHPALLLGRGDDCAEFKSETPLALSTDLFLEDVHFRRCYFTPEEIGHKALAVNLSDLASAGARPLGFSLGLMCPPDLEREYLSGIFRGMSELAGYFDIPLSGGDITAAPLLGFSITVWGGGWFGETGPFLRRGAEAGDALFLLTLEKPEGFAPGQAAYAPNGSCEPESRVDAIKSPAGLGLARLGLELLERQGRGAALEYPRSCAALLRPWPMLEAGRALAAAARESGGSLRVNVMDLSDGLRRDLPRLLEGEQRNRPFSVDGVHEQEKNAVPGMGLGVDSTAGLGADLDFEPSELHPELLRFYTGLPEERLLAAVLSGGDEYGLLCACPQAGLASVRDALERLAPGVSLLRLGTASRAPGIRWQGTDISAMVSGSGFDHFGE